MLLGMGGEGSWYCVVDGRGGEMREGQERQSGNQN